MSAAEESVPSQVRRHSRQLVREMSVVSGSYLDSGFTLSQCHVLFELSQNRSLKLLEIADRLLMDKSNTSRTVKKLVASGLIKVTQSSSDRRERNLSLTALGRRTLKSITTLANAQVERALDHLSVEEQATVTEGLRLYSRALQRSRLQSPYTLRRIKKRDNAQVAEVIRSVLTEFGAVGEGYSIEDPEVDDMYSHYRGDESCFCVLASDAGIVGCGGIAPLQGDENSTCELRKMFLLPQARGIGLGRRLLTHLLDEARNLGYQRCYLETIDRMQQANELYRRSGFKLLNKPIGDTGHCKCDRWYVLDL